MSQQENKLAKTTEKLGLYVVSVLTLLISFFLFAVSMLHTTAVEVVREGEGVNNVVWQIAERLESVIYYNDSFLMNLLMLGVGILLIVLLVAKVKRVPFRTLRIVLFVWTFLLGTVWVLSSQVCPSEDSMTVTCAGMDFAANNFDRLTSTSYFKQYPFQLGYVLFNECVFRVISLFRHPETVMVLEVMNAGFLAMIHVMLLSIMEKLFRDDRISLVTAVLLGISAAPVIDCTFTYGIYPGMAFAALAMYLFLRYLTEDKAAFGIGAAVSIAVAILLKSNYLIWMIAMVLIWLVKIPARKKYLMDGLLIAGTVVFSMAVQPAVKSFYESRSGVDLGEAIPYSSWIAMGLSETDLAPGWYNIYITVGNFEQSDFNAEEADRRSKELIGERLKYFIENPQYTNDFFYKKTVSQWNETSYQSIWNNTVRFQYKDKNAFADWVCNAGERKVKRAMDLFAQLVFAGFFLSAVYLFKRKQFLFTALPVVFLGGFFYQSLSEGKAQYIIPYFILMTAFAGFGLVSLTDTLRAYVKQESRFGKLLAATVPQPAAEAVGSAKPEPVKAEKADTAKSDPEKTAADAKTEPDQESEPKPESETPAAAQKPAAAPKQTGSKKKQTKKKKGAAK